MSSTTAADPSLIDSPYAAWRLLTTLGLVALGNSSMYVVSVVLPEVQKEFGVNRADASLPYTFMMVCLGIGGLWTGKWADRYGITRVLLIGSIAVTSGFIWAGLSGSIWTLHWLTDCYWDYSEVRQRLHHSWQIHLCGGTSVVVLRLLFVPAAITLQERFGHPLHSGVLRPLVGDKLIFIWDWFAVSVWLC